MKYEKSISVQDLFRLLIVVWIVRSIKRITVWDYVTLFGIILAVYGMQMLVNPHLAANSVVPFSLMLTSNVIWAIEGVLIRSIQLFMMSMVFGWYNYSALIERLI